MPPAVEDKAAVVVASHAERIITLGHVCRSMPEHQAASTSRAVAGEVGDARRRLQDTGGRAGGGAPEVSAVPTNGSDGG